MSQPNSESEVQLYQILQRANLLQYFDTFISQGGDDVQQLCEAGEEEFLEIMALVGMASKPLHVRRLQKALQEWTLNPLNFHQSLGMENAAQGSIISSVQKRSATVANLDLSNAVPASGVVPISGIWTTQAVPVAHTIDVSQVLPSAQGGPRVESKHNGSSKVLDSSRSDDSCNSSLQGAGISGRVSPVPGFLSHNELGDGQIKAIEMAAKELGKTLPKFEMKLQNVKRHICKDIETVIAYTTENAGNPDVIHLMRKYAAIYGRFDSKRKGEKRMTLHEVSVNEAASQLCCHRPNLLTQREVLFPLARQIVRESGYQYSKGHSRAQSLEGSTPCKKAKIDFAALPPTTRNIGRLSEITQEMSLIAKQQEELKQRMESAQKEGNIELIHMLQVELESFTSKQLILLTEKSELTADQNANGFDEKSNGKDDASDSDEELSPPSSSPVNGTENETRPKNKESLFDAGLRIAQAYGLGDFAQELKGLQDGDLAPPDDDDDDDEADVEEAKEPEKVEKKRPAAQIRVIEVDEQEEWNRAVEEDWKKQEKAKKS